MESHLGLVEEHVNPLLEIADHAGFITPDIDFGHLTPISMGGTKTPKQIGSYAWSMYGLLIFGNVAFYSDLLYRMYVVDIYQHIGLAGQTMWGAVNFYRIVTHYIVWLIAGFFWCLTFTSLPSMFIWFSYITYGLVIM